MKRIPIPILFALAALILSASIGCLQRQPVINPNRPPYLTPIRPDSQTAKDAAIQGVDLRIAGKTPAQAMPMFTTQNDAGAVYVRNTASWTAGVRGISAISVISSSDGRHFAATLVAPNTVAMSFHAAYGPGTIVRWVTDQNVVKESTITKSWISVDYAAPTSPDIAFGIIDPPITTIAPMRILPANWRTYISSSATGIPLCVVNQNRLCIVADTGSTEVIRTDSTGRQAYRWTSTRSTNATRATFFTGLIGGDSGCPQFMILNNEACLVTTNTNSAIYGGCWPHYRANGWTNPTDPIGGPNAEGWSTRLTAAGGSVTDFDFTGFIPSP